MQNRTMFTQAFIKPTVTKITEKRTINLDIFYKEWIKESEFQTFQLILDKLVQARSVRGACAEREKKI